MAIRGPYITWDFYQVSRAAISVLSLRVKLYTSCFLDREMTWVVFLKESFLYQFVNKDKILHWLNYFQKLLKVKEKQFPEVWSWHFCSSFPPSFSPGAGLPPDKKKGGPSPGDVEAIKVWLVRLDGAAIALGHKTVINQVPSSAEFPPQLLESSYFSV